MTTSSCPHAWLEPLRALFTDIGLASEEYSRAELIQLILNNLTKAKKALTILESVMPCYADAQRFLNWEYGLDVTGVVRHTRVHIENRNISVN